MYNQNQSTSLAAVKERYKGCNLLLPMSTEIQLNPFYKITVMEVLADVNEGSGDIFKVGSTKINGQFVDQHSPAKPLLMKLASAAGIQFDPNNTFGTYISKNCYKAKAYGAMRMPDGTGKTHCDEKVINLDDEEDRFRLEFMDKSLQGITDKKQAEEAAKLFKGDWVDSQDKWGKACKAYKIADADRQKYIDRGVLVNMTLLRKTFAEKAMTGAILRVVRALIGLKGTYTIEELKKPFAIPRVTFSPDYNDPTVRAAMMEQGMTSVSNMFGSTPPVASLAPHGGGMVPDSGVIDTSFDPSAFEDNAAFASDLPDLPEDDYAPAGAPPYQPQEQGGYQAPARQQYGAQPTYQPQTGNAGVCCEMCGAAITDKVAEFSNRRFGHPLCMSCQKEAQ